MTEKIITHKELRVFQNSMEAAIQIFHITKKFPKEEIYSLTNQITRSSRSFAANIAEAWRKRRYKAAFVAKLSDAEGEACETQVWLEIARSCSYLDDETCSKLDASYNHILGQLVLMIDNPQKWSLQ